MKRLIAPLLTLFLLASPAIAEPTDAAPVELLDATASTVANDTHGPLDAPLDPHAGSAGSAGSGSAAPHDSLDNPIESPFAAWQDLKAAREVGWALTVWAALAMLGKALAYASEKLKATPVIGKLSAWLAVGKRAMVVAAIGAVGYAGFDVLARGGTWVAALAASGVAIAGVTHSTTRA